MTARDTELLLYALLAIAGIVVLITVAKLHAFLVLTAGSPFVGLIAGHCAAKTVTSFENGVGSTLGYVGVFVALGTMLGKLLADSGGAQQIAQTVLRSSGLRRVPWAVALIAMLVGIPLFFEIGVVLLLPIIFTIARQVEAARQAEAAEAAEAAAAKVGVGAGRAPTAVGLQLASSSYLLVGIPALAGLSVLHGLVPPHPGPLTAITPSGPISARRCFTSSSSRFRSSSWPDRSSAHGSPAASIRRRRRTSSTRSHRSGSTTTRQASASRCSRSCCRWR